MLFAALGSIVIWGRAAKERVWQRFVSGLATEHYQHERRSSFTYVLCCFCIWFQTRLKP